MARPKRGSQEVDQAILDAQALELRYKEMSYRAIAQAQGCSHQAAYDRVKRAKGRLAGPEARQRFYEDLADLDALEAMANEVLEREHIVVREKGAIVDPRTGKPLLDDAPVLQAIATILRIKERRAKQIGYDAPARSEVTHHDGDSELDREIAGLLGQMERVAKSKGPLAPPSKTEPAHT